MLQLSANILDKDVLSLRTGSPVAKVTAAIFNPNNLKIEGFYCVDSFDKSELILLWQDIRETLKQGYVVDDHSVLVEPADLIRLKDILDINFELLDKQVITVTKQKVGKVSDYAVETSTMFVQKLYISQSIIKSFTGGSLSIDRNQVNEITPTKIIINDLQVKTRVHAAATAV